MRSEDDDWRVELVRAELAVRVFDLRRLWYGTSRGECSGRFELFIRALGGRGGSGEGTASWGREGAGGGEGVRLCSKEVEDDRSWSSFDGSGGAIGRRIRKIDLF